MIRLHDDLLTVLDSVEIISPTAYKLQGQPRDVPVDAGGAGRPPLVFFLENDLYGTLYTRPAAPYSAKAADSIASRDFVAALSAANGGRGTWELGWTIRYLDEDGRVAVDKDGLTFWVSPAGLRTIDGGVELGASCRVWVTKELRNLIPGFYLAVGNGEAEFDRTGTANDPLVRYYWNLTVGAAVPFLGVVTATLNAADVPFRVKVLSDPDAYLRADAGVLYLSRRHCRESSDAITNIHATVVNGLRPEVPLFTKPLARGLGLAEDAPQGNRSFGLHRCRLAAEALWSAFNAGLTDRDARAQVMVATFRQTGLDPMRPYLEPQSRDDYALPIKIDVRRSKSRTTRERKKQRT
jgi:hypothetical protein